MKFKVGDIIKGKHNEYGVTNERMTKGEVIENYNNIEMKIKILEYENGDRIGEEWTVDNSDKKFELIYCKKPTKQELLDMPIGTKIYIDAEDETYQEYVKKPNKNFEGKNAVILKEDINNNLTIRDNSYGTKIVKIEKPTYETVYDYGAEVQEMTVAEIEKALGHAVKIIKEDN